LTLSGNYLFGNELTLKGNKMKLSFSRLTATLGLLALGGYTILPSAVAQGVTKKPVVAAATGRALSSQRLKSLGLEMMMYAQDKGAYPPMRTPAAVQKALAPYSKASGASLSLEPGTDKPYLGNPGLSNMPVKAVKKPEDVVAFYEPVAASDGSRLICTADGRVLTVPTSKWTQVKHMFSLP
jgi:hypothetical protein